MAKSFGKVLGEGVIVGVLLIAFVYISSFLLHVLKYPIPATPEECKKWNSTSIMEVTVFLSGLLFHVACEYSGLNAYYAKHYFE